MDVHNSRLMDIEVDEASGPAQCARALRMLAGIRRT
jgi:hypothetical protein